MAETQSNLINRILAALIVLVAVFIVLVAGVTVRTVFLAPDAPRTAAERDMNEALRKIKANPRSAEAHNALGDAYFRSGNYDMAAAEYRKAMSLQKLFLTAQLNLANVYEAQGKDALAVRELQALLKKYPGEDNALFRLGQIHLRYKRYSAAITVLRRAVSFNPIDADYHFYLGFAYEKSRKRSLAIKEYSQVIRYVPDHDGARQALARLKKSS